ncbi:hypothetical protein AAFF_G00004780 [Aldrovandia affinis]|uniref:C2H2-type domain-containing protein n=1 Tax=Aldrovandia affinis TaxID=143900 RepID=A0AAD7X550_9TELE|nr:hypothetical protein AAFF_G00004780 [Aldrovandia affinis]
MSSSRDALRRQRRRELDARRSKSRVRLGACLQSWGQLKDMLGFALHSELAQYLLESYFSRVCIKCSGSGREVKRAETVVTSAESLQSLVLQVHRHGQRCPFPPAPHPATAVGRQVAGGQRAGEERIDGGEGGERKGGTCSRLEAGVTEEALVPQPAGAERGVAGDGGAATGLCLRYLCQGGHLFSWRPSQMAREEATEGRAKVDGNPARANSPRERGRRGVKEAKRESSREETCASLKIRRPGQTGSVAPTEEWGQPEGEGEEVVIDLRTTETGENDTTGDMCVQEEQPETESGQVQTESPQPQKDCRQPPEEDEKEADEPDTLADKNFSPSPKRDSTVIQRKATRGKRRKAVQAGEARSSARISKRHSNRRTSRGLADDDISQIGGKRKRKATPRDILPCEFDGCGKIFSSRQYLNHHMKYQHFHQKTFTCSHPSCGKSFNFKKHLKEHEKLHSNQRDYICEFCARAFRTSSNLIIHRRIHTGEKPLQCEVCGFTCRQKASLNWHMRKHNAESGYQFPCEICGRRFEKRDNVTAHRSKSHPAQAPGASPVAELAVPMSETPSPLAEHPTPAPENPGDLTGRPTDRTDPAGQSTDSTELAGQSADSNDLSIVVM